jgi:hypothetical protein
MSKNWLKVKAELRRREESNKQLSGRNYSLNEQETTDDPPVVFYCKDQRYIV